MADRRERNWMRAVSALLLAALLFALVPARVADAAPDQSWSKIEAQLLAQVQAAPTATFSVIARGLPPQGTMLKVLPGQTQRADSAGEAGGAIRNAGGDLRRTLSIVGAAAASLTGRQVLQLAHDARIAQIVADADLVVADLSASPTALPVDPTAAIREVNAPLAWAAGLTGAGVGIAVLDSGVADHPDLAARVIASVDLTGLDQRVSPTPLGDPGGHGTHVAGIIAGNGTRSGGAYTGVAPGADIISVRVIDSTGSARLSTILHGLQWILANRSTYHIRVVNMSFGARAQSGYQADLLASAAEVLSFAGIVPVVAAGNTGPVAGTISTPGTDPFVLTVGAVDDQGTADILDDTVALWSSRGPTAFDGIAKPDLVAPGRRIVSLRAAGSTLDGLYPERRVVATGALGPEYFLMSGTSMAAPIVSGTVALLLQRYPGLAPRQVKAQLRATAHPLLGLTAFDQGAGLVDAFAATGLPVAAASLSRRRVSNAFATDIGRLLYGRPLIWLDLNLNGGVDSRGLRWTDISWENITWNDISWENISWESFSWTDISWEAFTWADISWELLVAPLGGTGSGWVLVE